MYKNETRVRSFVLGELWLKKSPKMGMIPSYAKAESKPFKK